TDTHKFLYVRIPWGNIAVPDWPVDGNPFICIGLEVEIAPALRPPSPGQRFPTNLVSPYPVKRFFLYIGMLIIFYKKVLGCLVECVTTAYNWIFILHLSGHFSTMWQIPGIFG